MKIQFISDIHGNWDDIFLKDSDLLIITGDSFNTNNEDEVFRFSQWLKNEKIKHNIDKIIIIPGNHDHILRIDYYVMMLGINSSATIANSHIIEYGGLIINTFGWCDLRYWAFYMDKYNLNKAFEEMGHCDILVTHLPAYGILDYGGRFNQGNLGKTCILDYITKMKPLIHAHGHIHESYGVKKGIDTLSINSSMVDIYNNIVPTRESIVVVVYPETKIIDYELSDLPINYINGN